MPALMALLLTRATACSGAAAADGPAAGAVHFTVNCGSGASLHSAGSRSPSSSPASHSSGAPAEPADGGPPEPVVSRWMNDTNSKPNPVPPWGDPGGAILPAPNASLRQMTGIAWGGRQWAYADYIPFNAIHYPDSYNSTIHVWSSAGNCSGWVHHGPALLQGCASCWDAGGVATPSAAVVDGHILLSYSGRHHVLPPKGGAPYGTRGIGLATSTHPLGPFLRRPTPLAIHDGFSDDPQLVVHPAATTAAGRSMVWLYHRLSASKEVSGCGGNNRCVRLLTSEDGGEHWTAQKQNVCLRDEHNVCLPDTGEPLEAKLIASESNHSLWAVLLIMDQPDRAFVSAPVSLEPPTAPSTIWLQTPLGVPACALRDGTLGPIVTIIPAANTSGVSEGACFAVTADRAEPAKGFSERVYQASLTLKTDERPHDDATAELVTPQRNVFVAGEGNFSCFRIPAVVETKNPGELIVFAEGRGRRPPRQCSDHGDVAIVQRRSTDGGLSWGALRVVVDEYSDSRNGDGPGFCCAGRPGCKGCSTGNPAPIYDHVCSTLHLLFSRDNQDVFVTSSTDNGHRYTTPLNISVTVKPSWVGFAGTGPPNGVQLPSGRLIVAGYVIGSGSYAIYSDDGIQWKGGELAPNAQVYSGMGEAQIAQIPGGDWLAMSIRYSKTHRLVTFSSTQGQTWLNASWMAVDSSATCEGSLIGSTSLKQLLSSFPSTRDTKCPHMRCNISLWTTEVLSGSGPPQLGPWRALLALEEGYSAYSALHELRNQHSVESTQVLLFYEYAEACRVTKPPTCSTENTSGIRLATIRVQRKLKTDDNTLEQTHTALKKHDLEGAIGKCVQSRVFKTDPGGHVDSGVHVSSWSLPNAVLKSDDGKSFPLQCGSGSESFRFVALSWSTCCGMQGDRRLPIVNQTYTCKTYNNIVPLVNADFNPEHVECVLSGNERNASCPGHLTSETDAQSRGPNGTLGQPHGHRSLLITNDVTAILNSWNDNLLPQNGTGSGCQGVPGAGALCSVNVQHGRICPFPGPWWDSAIKKLQTKTAVFLATYRQKDGALDELVQDSELNSMKSSSVAAPSVPATCALSRWNAVEADSRWPVLLQELTQLGFHMTTNDSTKHPLATTMGWPEPVGSKPLSRNQVIWNKVTQRRMSDAWTSAFYEPAQRLFPAVKASNFDHYDSKASCCIDGACFPNGTIDTEAGLQFGLCGVSHGTTVGTLGAPSLYGEGGCGATGFEVARTGVAKLRGAVLAAAKGTGVRPWVMAKSICLDGVCPLHGSGTWWQERVIHMVMSGADSVYFFNPWADLHAEPAGPNAKLTDSAAMAAVLEELTEVAGCRQRTWVRDAGLRWSDRFLLSGLDVGNAGRRLWRFTPRSACNAAAPCPNATVRIDPRGLRAAVKLGAPLLKLPASQPFVACELLFVGGHILGVSARSSALGLWVVQPASATVLVECAAIGFSGRWPLQRKLKTDDMDNGASRRACQCARRGLHVPTVLSGL